MNELYEVMKMVDVMVLFYLVVGAGCYGIISVFINGVMLIRGRIKKHREKKKAREQKEDVTE